MKKIKDIFYDMNDILVALIIVALAAFVIMNNINSILAYPSSLAEEIQAPEKETPTNYAENPPVDQPGDSDTTDSDQQGTTGAGMDQQNSEGSEGEGTSGKQGSGKVEQYSVYINSGSTGEQIADILIGVGLFESRQEFYNAVAAANAEKKLKAGNFIIPSDATPAEIIAIITK